MTPQLDLLIDKYKRSRKRLAVCLRNTYGGRTTDHAYRRVVLANKIATERASDIALYVTAVRDVQRGLST